MRNIIFALAALLLTIGIGADAAVVFLPLVAFTQPTGGDPTVGLLPADRSAWANWKMAGLQSVGGIPNRTTQCGATLSPSGGDDTSAIQTAVNACPSGDFVKLNVGTFLINSPNHVTITTQITVRGSGACAGTGIGATIPYPSSAQSYCTLINRTNGAVYGAQAASGNPSPHFVLGPSDQYGNVSVGTAINLAADAAQGAYTIQLASTSGLTVGEVVVLDEINNLGWQANWMWPAETVWAEPDFRISMRAQNPTCDGGDQGGVCNGGSTPPNIDSIFHALEFTRYIMEIKSIASIGAGPCPGTNCTVTFDSPMTINYRAAQTAHIAPILGSSGQAPSTYVGLENLTMQGGDGGSVEMVACEYCWMKNTEDDDYYGYYTNADITIKGGFRDQLEGVYSHNAAYPAQGGAAYNWGLDGGSSEILIENSISTLADKVMVARGSGAGSVVAYNYADEGLNAGAGGLVESGLNASHWIGSHHVLFEGNWTWGADSDNTWGPAPFMTWLRNDVTGFRSTFHDYINNITINDIARLPGNGNGTNGNHAIAPMMMTYWHSYFGNVIGTPGDMSGWVYYADNQGANAIWNAGYNVNSLVEDGEVWTRQSGDSACVIAGDYCPLIRGSNYDYLTNSLADPSNPTIPNSFVFSSAPSYFSNGSGYAWPWINSQGSTKAAAGPTTANCTTNVSGPCSGLPAKARMDNGTPFVQP